MSYIIVNMKQQPYTCFKKCRMLKYICNRLNYIIIQYHIKVSCGHGTVSGFPSTGYILKYETYSRSHCIDYNNVSFHFQTECSFNFLAVGSETTQLAFTAISV
jgi:hypothetical protein